MEHSFDVETAEQHGVECAIVLKHLCFWVAHNELNDNNLRDGRYWTWNTAKAMRAYFPYWTVDQIRRVLDKLESSKIILRAHYSAKRTTWYTVIDPDLYMRHVKLFILRKHQMDAADSAESPSASGEIAKSSIADTDKKDPNTTAVATLGGRRRERKRTDQENAAFKTAAALFEERGGVWTTGKKEGPHLWALIDTAKKQSPDRWEALLGNMMGLYHQLVEGKIDGQDWYIGKSYTPSMLRSMWHSVFQIAKQTIERSPEAEAQAAIERARGRVGAQKGEA